MNDNFVPLYVDLIEIIGKTMTNRPSKEEAMQAVKTLLEWAGDDVSREGLIETPKRVVEAYQEWPNCTYRFWDYGQIRQT